MGGVTICSGNTAIRIQATNSVPKEECFHARINGTAIQIGIKPSKTVNYKEISRKILKSREYLAGVERKMINQEREEAIRSNELGEPWLIRYSIYPYCGHYKVRYAKWEDKQFSVAFWGVASNKLGCNCRCENCERMWE